MIYCLSCCQLNSEEKKVCSACSSSLEYCPKDKFKMEAILGDRYKVIAPINKGGMGELYAALDSRLNSICAVKELCPASMEADEKEYMIKRFKSEVEILAKLRHPHLPHVLDYFFENENYYLVMDYIAGHDLETVLEKEGNPGLEENRVLQWGITVCEVLEYLHNNKPQIIYRDLKPSNIMLRAKDKHIMLIDFGTARTMEGKVKRQTSIGTVGYAPPEQYTGEQDERSDIYSLGATLYHLVTGFMPVIPFVFPPARKITWNVSSKFEKILIKALKNEAKYRYQTAKDMKKDLMELYSASEARPALTAAAEKEDSWDLLGKIKKNILNSINKLRREFYTQKKIKVFILGEESSQSLLYRKTIETCNDIEITDMASTLEESLEKFNNFQEKPDVILMDIIPQTDEIQAITKIKNMSPSTKIILLSHQDIDRETVLNILKAGATGYIQKKTDHKNIIDGIRKAFQGGAPIDAAVVTYLLDEFVNKTRATKESAPCGFDGLELEEVDLFDLLIEFCSFEVTGKVAIKSSVENGEIYLKEGEIIHCVYGALTGEEAFYQTVNWFTGKARFYSKEVPESRTINSPTDKLLTEVLTRKEQFAKIRKVVKSPEDRFKMHLSSSSIITLQSDNLYILSHMDGKKTVLSIMKETGKTYFDVAKAIYELSSSGVAKKID